MTLIPFEVVKRFGHLLSMQLAERDIAPAVFSLKVGRSQNYVGMVIKGSIKPPLDELGRWATLLELNADQRREFMVLAMLAHCPPAIVEDFLRMKTKLDEWP